MMVVTNSPVMLYFPALELSDFEKAALDEAKRIDISKMPPPTIDSVNAKISKKASEKAVIDGITKCEES